MLFFSRLPNSKINGDLKHFLKDFFKRRSEGCTAVIKPFLETQEAGIMSWLDQSLVSNSYSSAKNRT